MDLEIVHAKSNKPLVTIQDQVESLMLSILLVLLAYLIFVIFFTQANFLENKIYTEKRQFFAFYLKKTPLFRVKSVENANFSR